MKPCLIERGVLKNDVGGRAVVSHENVDQERLKELALDMANLLIGTNSADNDNQLEFADHNPMQLFDFSSKVRTIQLFCSRLMFCLDSWI